MAARFEYAGLDRVIHERARLGIVTSLASHPQGLRFNDLKQLCGLTDGNLSRHLAVLETAGMVAIEKSFRRKRPETRCKLTRSGRARFVVYLDQLQHVVADAAAARVPHGLGKLAVEGAG
ncbi:MAG TPA: transcriptional regulator [Terriglobales bacterium]|nr:transcriptional regulator [Terriglobales bacterium]